MKRVIFACLGLIGFSILAGAQETYQGPKEGLHVYLLIGQSNMAGRAPYGEEDAGVVERCFLLNDKDQWEPAKNPFNRYSTVRKGLNMQKMNPGYTFSQAMLKAQPAVSLGLVVNAKGGTSINEWGKGTKFYNEAVRRAKEAQKTGVLKGILWHQGESDSGKPDGYAEKLKALVESLRQDLDAAEVPFVAGKVYDKPGTAKINEQLAKVPEVIPLSACVSVDGLGSGDKTHFDHAGMKQLGERYAAEMLRLQTLKK